MRPGYCCAFWNHGIMSFSLSGMSSVCRSRINIRVILQLNGTFRLELVPCDFSLVVFAYNINNFLPILMVHARGQYLRFHEEQGFL